MKDSSGGGLCILTGCKWSLAIRIDWNWLVALEIFHSDHNSEYRVSSGGVESSPREKSAFAPWVLPKAHNLEEILYDNQERGSVSETSARSQDNIKTLTPSVRTTMEIAFYFWPEKKIRRTQIQRILKIFLRHNNITYRKKVVVKEVHYSTYYVLVTEKILVHNV